MAQQNIEQELSAVRAIIAAVENLDTTMKSRVLQAAQVLMAPSTFQPPVVPQIPQVQGQHPGMRHS